MPIIDHKDFKNFLSVDESFKNGCIVDTNILFATTFSDDAHHEQALKIVSTLIQNEIPLLTNVNIRSEFINLALKVVVPQGLSDLFKDAGVLLPKEIYKMLKSIHQTINDGHRQERVIKLKDSKIKSVRKALSSYNLEGQNLWELFCDDYIEKKLMAEWNLVEDELGLNFISLRFSESAIHLKSELLWDDVIHIMEQTAINSSDAMIVNLLDKSRYSLITSLDEDIKFALKKLGMDDKFLVI